MKAFLINLQNEQVRLKKSTECLMTAGFAAKDICRIEAVYGKNLTSTERRNATSFLGSFFMTDSVIGCGLSHIKAWETFLSTKDEFGAFFEDDIYLCGEYAKPENNIIQGLEAELKGMKERPDFWYLGSIQFPLISKAFNGCSSGSKWQKQFLVTGAHAYVLTRCGAELLLANIKHKIGNHVDFMITTLIQKGTIKALLREPCIFEQASNNANAHLDSCESSISSKAFPAFLRRLDGQNCLDGNVSYASLLGVQLYRFGYPGTEMSGFTTLVLISGIICSLSTTLMCIGVAILCFLLLQDLAESTEKCIVAFASLFAGFMLGLGINRLFFRRDKKYINK